MSYDPLRFSLLFRRFVVETTPSEIAETTQPWTFHAIHAPPNKPPLPLLPSSHTTVGQKGLAGEAGSNTLPHPTSTQEMAVKKFPSCSRYTSGYLSCCRVPTRANPCKFLLALYVRVALRVRARTRLFSALRVFLFLFSFFHFSFVYLLIDSCTHSPSPPQPHYPSSQINPKALQDSRSEAWTDSVPEHVCRLLHARR